MAAWTQSNVDACQLQHHLLKRGDLFFWRIGQSYQLTDGLQVSGAVAVGQESVMTDSDKPFWKAVEQEPTDELDGRYGDEFLAVLLSVFDLEGDHGVFKVSDAAVGNSDPVSIACQVFKDVVWAIDRIPHIDDPVFFIQPGFELFILIAWELDVAMLTGGAHALHELAAKDQRQGVFVKKIVSLAGCPA